MTIAGGRTSVCGWAVLVFCGVLTLACAARAELVVYPEYPAALERDFAYTVSVTQKGGETKPLVVYNHTEQSALSERTRGGDVNRRFCEFAFSGEPVRVDIRVRRDVSSYKVFPARLALRHRFKDGVISVRVDHPMRFGIQLNDRDHTILSVFADPPETDVPAKDAPGVMYVEGWRDAPGRDGVVEIGPDVRELYLAPGSVFNARLRVCGAGTKVHGRGVVLDPMSDIFRYDQTANAERGLFVVRAPKVSVEGIKFLDARTFNLMSFHPDVSFRNVKVLSSMMCSDGMTCGSTGLTVENCWFYVGDNAVVLSGVTGARFRDVALGTSCAAIFPQNSNRDVLFERTDVFRCDDGLINNRYNGVLRRNNKWSELGSGLQKKEPGPQDLPHQTDDIAFRDLSAVDCTLFPHLFSGRNMGVKPKRYAFTNLSVPKATGKSHWRAAGRTGGCLFRVDNDPKLWLQTGNYSFAITNLVLDGEEVRTLPKGSVKGSDGEIRIAVAATADPGMLPRRANRTEVEWKSSERNPGAAQGAVTNLLAETSRAKSVWQRFPSWSVKLEATKKDEKGSTVYRLVQCERNAGMQAVITDAFLGRGNGRWCLRCEARVADGRPLTLTARLLSNETECSGRAKLEPGGWQRLEIDFDTNFDLNVTELVALVLGTDRAVSELEFRDFAFVRDEEFRAPLGSFAETMPVRVAKTIRPGGTGFCFNPDFHTYLPFNDDYAVTLAGKPAEVRACRESRIPFNRPWPGRQRPLDQTERASYIAFEGEGPVAVTVRPKRKFATAVVRPLSAGVRTAVRDGIVSFTLPRPGYYVCEVDGAEKALQLLYETPRDFAEKERATVSYGPGMHMAGIVRLKDHDRVYVDRDAIVFGCFMGSGVRDVKIFGHGVIDGRSVERVFEGCYSELQPSCIRLHHSRDISVDGPVLLDSPNWVLALFDCDDVDIRHVKIAGQWRYNTDGIDVCNSRRVAIRDCYVRFFDDTIVIKGVPPYREKPVEDIAVERCVMWCGWGKTLEPGVETWASRFRNVRVSDCDLIHSSVAALNVSAGGTAVQEDFLYDGIRVELQSDTKREILQKADGQKYDPGDRPHMRPLLLRVSNGHYAFHGQENEFGHVRNLTVRNLQVFTDGKFGKPEIKVCSCAPEGNSPRLFENIVIEGTMIDGRPATESDFTVSGNSPVTFRNP